MERIASAGVSLKHFKGDVRIVVWERGDPFPDLGPDVGVDTETERFSDTVLVPPLVVLGVFDPKTATCYEVYWDSVAEFMSELCSRDIRQYYFNVGYDEPVMGNEDPDKPLLVAANAGRVRDMQIRSKLYDIATVGFVRYELGNLAGCTLHYENWQLDKGDGTEDSARLSFVRARSDGSRFRMSREQAVYLMYDCLSTWCLGHALPEQSTEVGHTLGMIVLAHISINGMQVDPVMYRALKGMLLAGRERHRQDLILYGFPDPDSRGQSYATQLKAELQRLLERIEAEFRETGWESLADLSSPESAKCLLSKNGLRRLLMSVCADRSGSPGTPQADTLHERLAGALAAGDKALKKAEREGWNGFCEEQSLMAADQSASQTPMLGYVRTLLSSLLDALQAGAPWNAAVTDALEAAGDALDEHPEWLSGEKPLGPRKFFQDHVQRLLERNPGLKLETTAKSGEIKLTMKDMWRLEDCGITDGFLDSYTRFNHCVKYLSTYMNDGFIKPDGRVHSRYESILRTGRTSCSGPLSISRASVR